MCFSILFSQDWVFLGVFQDVYKEFMIKTNIRYLESRDEQYWEKGYTMDSASQGSGMPLFLADLAPDIFRCGKILKIALY